MKQRPVSELIFTSHFFINALARGILKAKEMASSAVSGKGELHPSPPEDGEPTKWYCIFKDEKSELFEVPVVYEEKHNKRKNVLKTIYRITEFKRLQRKRVSEKLIRGGS